MSALDGEETCVDGTDGQRSAVAWGGGNRRSSPEPLRLRRLGRRRPGAAAPNSINVLMVNNPQMVDLQQLTADNFTKETGITVNFTVLPENDVRDKISQEFSSQAGQYDVAIAQQLRDPDLRQEQVDRPAGRLHRQGHRRSTRPTSSTPMTTSLSAEDGKVYGEPFYGESSFLMYRKDVLDAKGITMPAKPDLAAGRRHRGEGRRRRARDGRHLPARPARLGPALRPADHGGEHLRRHLVHEGLDAQVNAPEFTEATNFYVDLVRAHGENGAPQAGLHRVPEQPHPGQRRHVVRRHVGRRLARGRRTPRSRARSATSPRPSVKTDELRLALRLVVEHPEGQHEEGQRLEVHLLGLQQGVRGARRRASSAGRRSRPASGPRPTRTPSTSRSPRRSPSRPRPPSRPPTRTNPGVQPRPALGIQFVDIPEFPDLGTQVSRTSARRSPAR